MAISKRIRNGIGMLADMPPIALTAGKMTEQQAGFLSDSLRGIIRAFNGQVSFGNGTTSTQSGNIDGQTKEHYFADADTDYEIPHGLARVPIGVLMLDVNVDGAVVRGNLHGDWSTTRLFLRCSQAGTTALFVVV